LKICILAPEFLPVWGGVGSYIIELVRHLPRNTEIHVVAPSRDRLGGKTVRRFDYDSHGYFSENVHIHLISEANDTFLYNAAFQYACLKFVPRLVKDEHIDLIHSHTAHMPDLLLEFRKLNVPTLTTIHTTIFGQRQGAKRSGSNFSDLEFSEKATLLLYPFLRLAEEVYFLFPRSYLTPSNWMKMEFLRFAPRVQPANVQVIHNSVDTKKFIPTGEEKKFVLFTGRFIAAKGLAILVDAIPLVLAQHPDTKFVFIGPGRSTQYETRLKEHNVPNLNFEFKGYLEDRSTLIEYYRRCAIFVAPTLYENMPIRILEAMASGKPVIASDICGIPEAITPNKNGVLVPPGDVGALATAISKLIGDETLRQKLGKNARETVESKFDSVKNAQRVARVYQEVIAMT
jgi:glycosyltransferase involved in cell wall biosynthesis